MPWRCAMPFEQLRRSPHTKSETETPLESKFLPPTLSPVWIKTTRARTPSLAPTNQKMASFYDDDLTKEIQQDTARIARILSNGIHTYDIPSTKPVDFSHVFPGPFDEPRTLDVLSIATVHREEAAASFTYSNAVPDPRNIVNALKRYFPDVWCLTESMRRAGAAGNIRLNMKGQLLFQWSSIVDNCSRSNTWSNSTFVYEIIMVLVHYGLMHSNVAKNQATGGKHVEASKTLKQGAGVLKFVCVELLPKWQSRPAKVPLECEADVLDGCARLMMAQSQQMAIAKVLSSGKSFPPGTLAKLLLGTHVSGRWMVCGEGGVGLFFLSGCVLWGLLCLSRTAVCQGLLFIRDQGFLFVRDYCLSGPFLPRTKALFAFHL